MSIWEELDSRARRLGIIDTKLAQGSAMCVALVVVKLVPEVLTVSGWWFVGVGIACAIKPMITFFGSGPQSAPRSQGA